MRITNVLKRVYCVILLMNLGWGFAQAENQTQEHAPIVWSPLIESDQLLQPNTLPSLFLSEDELVLAKPFWVTLPAHRWLFIGGDWLSQHGANAPMRIDARVFDAPYLGRVAQISSASPFIAPAHHNRIVQLLAHKDAVSISAFLGRQNALDVMLPLDTLQPESGQRIEFNLAHRNALLDYFSSGDNSQAVESRSQRTGTSPQAGEIISPEEKRHSQAADRHLPISQNKQAQHRFSFEIAPNEHYLLESVYKKDNLTTTRRFEQKQAALIKSKRAPELSSETLTITHQEDASLRYRILANDEAYVRAQEPTLFHSGEAAHMQYDGAKDERVRLQALSEDWLFAKNYERYEKPVIEAQLARQEEAEQSVLSETPATTAHKEWDVRDFSFSPIWDVEIIEHEAEQGNAAVSDTLNGNSMPTQTQSQHWHYLATEPKVWRFAQDLPHFVPPDIITPNSAQIKSAYLQLKPGRRARFFVPEQALAPVLRLQIALDSNEQTENEKAQHAAMHNIVPSTKISLSSEQGDTQQWQLGAFQNLLQHSFQGSVQNVDQSLLQNNAQTSVQNVDQSPLKDSAQSLPLTLADALQSKVATATWQQSEQEDTQSHLPAWRVQSDVALSAQAGYVDILVEGTQPVLLRVQYPVQRRLHMDEHQWLQLFQAKRWEPWQSMDAVQSMQAYLQLRKQGFAEGRQHAFWQAFLTDSKAKKAVSSLQEWGVNSSVRALLHKPDIHRLSYWEALNQAMQQENMLHYRRILWQMLVLYHPSQNIKNSAFLWLEQALKANQNTIGLEQLYAVMFLANGAYGEPLAQILLHKGEYAKALLLLAQAQPDNKEQPKNTTPPDNKVQVYRPTLGHHSKQGHRQTQAHHQKKQHHKAYIHQAAMALGLFKVAEQYGDATAQHEAFSAFHKSPMLSLTSVQSAGVLRRYHPALKVQGNWFKGSSQQPVVIKNDHASLLVIEARQWFSANAQQANKGVNTDTWLDIHINQTPYSVPLFYADYRASHFAPNAGAAGAAHPIQILLPQNSQLVLAPRAGEAIFSLKQFTASRDKAWTSSPCYRESRRSDNPVTCTQLFYQVDVPSIKHLPFLQGDGANSQNKTSNAPFVEEVELVRDIYTQAHIAALPEAYQDAAQTFLHTLNAYEQSALSEKVKREAIDNKNEAVKGTETEKGQVLSTTLSNALHATLHQFPESDFKTRFTQRLQRDRTWKPLQSPLSSAGIKRFKAPRASVLNPVSARGVVLLVDGDASTHTAVKNKGERLPSASTLLYQFNPSTPTQARFTLSMDAHLFDDLPAVDVAIYHQNKQVAIVPLAPLQIQQQVLDLPASLSEVSFALFRSDGRQKVYLRTEVKDASGQWQPWQAQRNVNLHQVNAATPIQFHLPKPRWIRVDEFAQSTYVTSHYRAVEAGIFRWQPKPDANIGYRFFALEDAEFPHREDALHAAYSSYASSSSQSEGVPVPPKSASKDSRLKDASALASIKHKASENRLSGATSIPELAGLSELSELAELPEQPQAYTWSLGAIYDKGFEQTGDRLVQQDFTELRLQYNGVSANGRLYQQSQLAIKNHQDLANSYHARFSWEGQRAPDDFNWRADVGVHYQSGIEEAASAWSVDYRLSYLDSYQINRQFFNNWRFFIQGVMLNDRDNEDVYYSQVYSDYKAEHQFGVGVVDRLRYKLAHDADVYLEGRLLTNDLQENLSLDQARLSAGARLFYQGVLVEAQLTHRHFYQDDNRDESSEQNTFNLKFDWMLFDNDDSWRMQFDFQRDIDDSENAWFFSVIYGNHDWRGVKDALPGTLPYRGLRERQFLQAIRE